MQKRVWALLFVLQMLATASAPAGPTSFGFEVAGTHGTHREHDGSATAPLIPAPILTASHAFGCFEASAEALPPMGPISFGDNGLGMKDIALTYGDAVLRYWNPSHSIAVGAGDTLYNQRTDFSSFSDRSRVAGTRYELTARKSVGSRDFLQARIGIDPAMHGRFTQTQTASAAPGDGYTTQPIWERAAQVDVDAGFTHEFREYAISYGVRYLNYSAAFSGGVRSPFADANSLVMPYVAIVRTWGDPEDMSSLRSPSCTRLHAIVNVQAFIGGEVFTGTHQDVDGAVRDAAVGSIPLYALRARYKKYEVMLEDVPAVGPIHGTARTPGMPYDVKAGYADAVLRYWRPSGLGFGIGDSLYVAQRRVEGRWHYAQRAAGLRYEVLQRFALDRQNRMLLALAISPSMHQRSSYWLDKFNVISRPGFAQGSLFDAWLQFETALGARHMWVYGLRYLNYAAGDHYRYDGLKERTGVLGGFAAWGFAVGH